MKCDFNPSNMNKETAQVNNFHAHICSASCNEEFHIEKGYSNAIVNFFVKEEIFALEDNVRTYITMLNNLFDENLFLV